MPRPVREPSLYRCYTTTVAFPRIPRLGLSTGKSTRQSVLSEKSCVMARTQFCGIYLQVLQLWLVVRSHGRSQLLANPCWPVLSGLDYLHNNMEQDLVTTGGASYATGTTWDTYPGKRVTATLDVVLAEIQGVEGTVRLVSRIISVYLHN